MLLQAKLDEYVLVPVAVAISIVDAGKANKVFKYFKDMAEVELINASSE
jgi:hydrogenase maturation factor